MMSEEPVNRSFGILKSLKKLIFEDSPEPAGPDQAPAISTPAETKVAENVTKNPQTNLTQNTSDLPAPDVKQMKVKVLEILERINEPGIDFFEVWNAAAEMGSVDVNSVKAAFTSLRYVDKTLTKDKLLLTGGKYAAELKNIIDKETSDKQSQKQYIEQSLVKEKASLTEDIAAMEKSILDLQEKLSNRQKELKEINSKYTPELEQIDQKIAIGNTAVTEVITDIKNALTIIEKNIN
jgi:vacuolar-type H+-ATPase subunit I/STV1